MGQAGSVQQQHALRNVLSLRAAPRNVSDTELEEVLRTFCALFPLELQVPDASFSNVVRVAVKQRRLFDVMHELLQEQTVQLQVHNGQDMTPLILQSFRRVIRWRELYKLCAKCSLKPFLACLQRPSQTSVLSGLETLELMLSPCLDFDMGDKTADRSEAANRRHFADAGGYEVLRSLLVQYGATVEKMEKKNEAAVVLQGVLKVFIVTLVPRRAITDAVTCTQAVEALMDARVTLLDLCHCRDGGGPELMTLAIRLVKGLFCIVDLDQVQRLQESAREYGALLYTLKTAVQEGANKRTIEHGKGAESKDEVESNLQEMCVDLVEMFCAGNISSTETMYRIFPVGLFMPAKICVEPKVQHTVASPLFAKTALGSSGGRALPHFSFEFDQPRRQSTATSNVLGADGSVGTKRNRFVKYASNAGDFGGSAFEIRLGEARKKGEHWREIMKAILCTHESPELVWRVPMRAELYSALRGEIEAHGRRRRHMVENKIVQFGERIPLWHHEMFDVRYPSLDKELVVNNYFVEYLIPRVADLTNTYEIAEPVLLAWHLFDRLAVEDDENRTIMCARCLRLVVRRYAMLFHGQIPAHYVLVLLRDHMNHSPAFVRECFLLLSAAVVTSRNIRSAHFGQLGTIVARTVVDVLADPALLASLSTPLESVDEVDEDTSVRFVDPEDKAVVIVNQRDGMLRAGISVLLTITRSDKSVLQLLRPKRIFLCRLIAVETLDHVTITHIFFLLEQLELLDNNGWLQYSFRSSNNIKLYIVNFVSLSIDGITSKFDS
uniref:DnaJ homologue subfamily C GRV2/DNAJC13 N-terminal domain-containing protein n=1 Tax=Peronospora matthiolae TaxID=2874970 RepID=A0AAV1U6Q8_9STRA